MIKLQDILYTVPLEAVHGNTSIAIRELRYDSRLVGLDDVFVATTGTTVDGHDYIERAVNAGAIAVICEVMPDFKVNGITYVQVQNSQKALAIMAANYHGNPSKNLKLVGITGTNGKTTTATLLYDLFTQAGYSCGLLSTVVIKVAGAEYKATHTTPDSLVINDYLSLMNAQGVEFCFMEVSSHGIDQERTTALQFAGGVFTNLSHDHLDYHDTFKEYRDVKERFFDQLNSKAFAITNLDDKNGSFMLQNTKAQIRSYALKSYADYRGQILESSFNGQLLKINEQDVWTKLIGQFNAYNLTAVYAVAIELGLEPIDVLTHISKLEPVAGRFQYAQSETGVHVIVDYAHTPDALDNVLKTIQDIRTRNEQLITLVGCGGDRDTSKRPVMAQIASSGSDKTILTSDNPRTEDPDSIIRAMEEGVEAQYASRVLSITDRRQAIRTACSLANPGDILLVAGKGHETYQEINGERTDFDDFKITTCTLTELNK